MFSGIAALIAKYKAKRELKKLEKNNQLSQKNSTDKQKKVKRKIKAFNIIALTSFSMPVIAVIVAVMVLITALMTYGSLAGNLILRNKKEESDANEENGEWSWEITQDTDWDKLSSGGIYPKDPELRQLAMFIECLNNSCSLVNGSMGETVILPSSVISVLVRETGGKAINTIVANPSLNIFTELIYQNPICGKGGSCTWINNGVSHFVGGSVTKGKDLGDPHTQYPDTSNDKYQKYLTSDGHALGYGQMEVIYIDSYMNKVYPSGMYKDNQYNNDSDKWKMDNILNFIRPNIAYLPDVLYAITSSLGGNLSGDADKVYQNMIQEDWYKSLSEGEKAFCRSCMRQMSYIGGSVDTDNMNVMKQALKVCWGVKSDGLIEDIRDIVELGNSRYSDISKDVLSTIWRGNKVYRPSTSIFTDIINKVIDDSSIGSITSSCSSELKLALAKASANTENNFLYYTASNGFKWRYSVPSAIGFESAAYYIYKDIINKLNNAEKENSEQQGTSGFSSGGNYIGDIGSGQFNNVNNSEYYSPSIKAIWFSQNKAGGQNTLGMTVPSYSTTIQKKPYMGLSYKQYGCPAYSMAMLISNMTGQFVLPDQLPGTTGATSDWGGPGKHNVSTSGLGFTSCPNFVLPAVNKELQKRNAGFQLKWRQLSVAELKNKEEYIYDWFDNGAMLWVRVVSVPSNGPLEVGNHFVTLCGYDKTNKVGDYYDIRVLNSISAKNQLYTLTDSNNGQLATAANLAKNGLAYHLRDYPKYCCIVVWRDDLCDNMPGL